MTVVPRPSILAVEPYVGGESKIPGVNRIVKLSSNEGPFGPPPGAIEAIRAMAAEAHRYPDGGAKAIREAIGARFGLDPARIVVGNGSDELLALLILAYGGEGTELVMSAHGFLMYEITGLWAGCRIIKVPEKNLTTDVDALLAAVTPRTRMLFLANPNNPTGTYLPAAEVERLQRGLRPDILFVLDSAYAEYVTAEDYSVGIDLVNASDNVVMVRTFSKMGIAGERVGWMYGPEHVVDAVNRIRGPFNVSLSGQAAAAAAARDVEFTARLREHNARWRSWLTEALASNAIRVPPSQGNFILALFEDAATAKAAFTALRETGLLVREMHGYGIPRACASRSGSKSTCARWSKF
jgi:histidinol-phosphate aminotransferase